MADDELLNEVAAAADAALQAQADGDNAEDAKARALSAARAALDGGHPIAAIAAAEAAGERAARERAGGQVLRAIERAARKLREVTGEYEETIAKAVRLGLPARDIAGRAGVSHGTVTAVARRFEQANTAAPAELPVGHVGGVDAGVPAPESGAG